MRVSLSVAGAACFFLAACSAPTPQIPADLNDAAQFCVAAKMLSMSDEDGRQRGDRMTLSAAVQQQAYPMIAASKLEGFATFIDEGDLVSSDQVVSYGEEFDPLEVDQLALRCDAHFGISGALSIPTLPTDDFEAIYSCFAATHWTATVAAQSLFDDEGRGPRYRQLLERMTTKKDIAVAQRGGIDEAKGGDLVLAGLRHAFSQGNIMNYVAACDARFRGSFLLDLE